MAFCSKKHLKVSSKLFKPESKYGKERTYWLRDACRQTIAIRKYLIILLFEENRISAHIKNDKKILARMFIFNQMGH